VLEAAVAAVPVVVLQAVAEVEQAAGPAEAVRAAVQVEPLLPARTMPRRVVSVEAAG
jgi:hypothetical protein